MSTDTTTNLILPTPDAMTELRTGDTYVPLVSADGGDIRRSAFHQFDPPRPGQPITENDFATWKKMVPRIRRCIKVGSREGRPWDAAAAVGEIAQVCRTTPDEVVRLIRLCGWLIAVNESEKPIEQWTVYEDGE